MQDVIAVTIQGQTKETDSTAEAIEFIQEYQYSPMLVCSKQERVTRHHYFTRKEVGFEDGSRANKLLFRCKECLTVRQYGLEEILPVEPIIESLTLRFEVPAGV